MRKLSNVYADNVAQLDRLLRVEENFDVIKKPLRIGQDEVTLYYIDGFVKDTVMQKLMLSLVSLDGLGSESGGECARAFTRAHYPGGRNHVGPVKMLLCGYRLSLA